MGRHQILDQYYPAYVAKLDLKKEFRHLYTSSTTPNLVEMPESKYLTIAGRGAPGGEAYQAASNALYSVAYTVKFKAKALGTDFTVMGLEGLWWWDRPDESSSAPPREQWNWKSMIRQPDLVTEEMVEEAKKEVARKRDLPG